MSRKQFKLIAAAIAQIKDEDDRRRVANMIAAVCKQTNGEFQFGKFY
jgi:hypothetical protein